MVIDYLCIGVGGVHRKVFVYLQVDSVDLDARSFPHLSNVLTNDGLQQLASAWREYERAQEGEG